MTEHARIAPLPNLPLFHKLEGRKAVVVGSSDGATWKAELLEAAGANVIRLDSWTAHDLVGAALAIADLSDREEALRFVEAAHAAGAVVNIIDQTDLCDVTFGTIVNRAPVVVAISTDGAAPVLGQSIRSRIEPNRSSGDACNTYFPYESHGASMSRWKCMVPFGSPVVPDVKAMRQTSSIAVSS